MLSCSLVSFVNENKHNINKQVYLELKRHQKDGDKIVLLTSVFEEIAYEYSLIFRIDGIFASKLEYKNISLKPVKPIDEINL